jgi:predicted nucleic acid-binding protein
MRLVLDFSVALKWVMPEIDSDKADLRRLGFRNGTHEFLAPEIFTVEAAHALTRAERQGRVSVGKSRMLFLDLLTTQPHFHSFQPLLLRAIDISSRMHIGIYDSVYVALAEQEDCDLLTADDRLVMNLQPRFPFVVALSSIS